jgi:hypothetical protein
MKNLLVVAGFLLSLVIECRAFQANDTAQTISTDGSYSDTAQALGYVAGKNQDGWVITVGAPGGVYVWTNTLVCGATKTVTLQSASPTQRSQILFDTSAYAGIYVSEVSNHLFTIKDFIFNWVTNQPVGCLVGLCGNGVCFRLSNCQFSSDAASKFVVQVGSVNTDLTPGPFGVIDHCQFLMPVNDTFNLINVRCNGCVSGYSWTLPMSWGTTNSVVMEDDQFSVPLGAPVGAAVEADGGARFTVRNCTLTNIPISAHGVASGAKDSTLQIECYNNHFNLTDPNNTMPYMFWQRGGTCVIWGNTVSAISKWSLAKVFYFSVECASSQWQSESCSNHLSYPADYPGFQQVGQGVVNGAQGSVPIYIWGNTTPQTYYGDFALGMDGGDNPFIQPGRDIFENVPMPGYTALAYPHPLVAAGGTVPTGGGSTTSNAALNPPQNLQAHPPASQ